MRWHRHCQSPTLNLLERVRMQDVVALIFLTFPNVLTTIPMATTPDTALAVPIHAIAPIPMPLRADSRGCAARRGPGRHTGHDEAEAARRGGIQRRLQHPAQDPPGAELDDASPLCAAVRQRQPDPPVRERRAELGQEPPRADRDGARWRLRGRTPSPARGTCGTAGRTRRADTALHPLGADVHRRRRLRLHRDARRRGGDLLGCPTAAQERRHRSRWAWRPPAG